MKKLIIILYSTFSLGVQQGDYKDYYMEGASHFTTKDYSLAITSFKKSYQLKPLSQTAYYIALSYDYIKNVDSCYHYSAIVLKDAKAKEQYKTECKKMFDSCEAIIKKNQTLNRQITTRTVVSHDT